MCVKVVTMLLLLIRLHTLKICVLRGKIFTRLSFAIAPKKASTPTRFPALALIREAGDTTEYEVIRLKTKQQTHEMKKLKSIATGTGVGVWLFAGATVAMANPSSEIDLLLDLMHESGKLTAQEKSAYRERLSQERRPATPAPRRAAPRKPESEIPAIQMQEPRYPGLDYEPTMPLSATYEELMQARPFRVESADGKNRFGLRGRLMVDGAIASWDDNLARAADHGNDDLPDRGTIVRRARLGALGIYDNVWEWQMEIDFRDEEVRFANAYVAYLSDYGRFAIGNFKEPFSLESSTSSRRLTFMERATPVDAFRPSRSLGIMYETLVPNYYVGFGLFGGEGVSRNRDVEEGYSAAIRASFSPYSSDSTFTHLGFSANYRHNSNDQEPENANEPYSRVRLRSREGARAMDIRLIGRRDLEAVKDYQRYALEAAWGTGPFSLQAEYVRVDASLDRAQNISRRGGGAIDQDSITQDGFYVQASYFLTGEQRNYRAFSGDFGPMNILSTFGNGGTGAWELAARYSYTDASEHSRAGRGAKMTHYTLGLNWYPNDQMVFKTNYMYFDYEGRAGRGEANGNHVLAFRAQYEF